MGITSPDLPAYICYAIVLLIGALAASAAVRTLLPDLHDRYAFGGAWLLWLIYSLLPVALFWFLDYAGAVRDTSIFAAIFIALAYQQIFAGSVKEITLPNPVQALWIPLQKWLRAIADRITANVQSSRERFAQLTLDAIQDEKNPNAPAKLIGLFQRLIPPASKSALQLSKADKLHQILQTRNLLTGIQQDLNALPAGADAARIALEWKTLAREEPDHFGDILWRSGIVSGWRLWWFLRNGRAKFMTYVVVYGGALVLFLAWTAIYLRNAPEIIAAPTPHQDAAAPAAPAAFDRPAAERPHEPLRVTRRAEELLYRAAQPVEIVWTRSSILRDRITLWYYRWRLRKTNTSPQDFQRTEDFIRSLASRAQRDAVRQPPPKNARAGAFPDYLKPLDYVLGGVLHDFCSAAEPAEQVDRILPLVYKIHSSALDSMMVERLLDCMQTDNPDTRERIQRTLTYLAQADFPQAAPPSTKLTGWVPVKDEPLGLVDCHMRGWMAWWLPKFGQAVTFSDACLQGFAPAVQPALAPAKP